MVAHSGFITVARKVDPGFVSETSRRDHETEGVNEETVDDGKETPER
jgi:hypothetical protein